MKICRLIRYDIIHGFSYVKYKYAVVIMIAWISCMDFYNRKKYFLALENQPVQKGTYMDYVFYLLGGMKEYTPYVGTSFVIPIKWIFLCFYLLYCTLGYPYKDLLKSIGGMILLQSGNRRAWWLSKCLWNILFIISAYGAALLTVGVFCFVKQEQLSMVLTPQYVCELMNTGCVSDSFPVSIASQSGKRVPDFSAAAGE